MQVIDSHAHFGFRPENSERPAEHYASVTVPVEELLREADAAGIDRIIQVVPTVMGYDNAYSLRIARRYPDRLRMFARFDPTLPEVQARLRALLADPFVLGVRIWGLGREQNWVEDGAFEPFWPQAQALSLPVAIYAPNRAARIRDIARRFPALTLLLDHALVRVFETERPPSPFEGWNDILALADLPNVYLKVSGLPEATNERYPFPQAQQRLRELSERFGAERLIWGSNYPHTRRVCTYKESVDFVRVACEFLSEAERAAILGKTLQRIVPLPW